MSNNGSLLDARARLTLREKASLMSGANFWNTKPVERVGVPAMMLTDGPHGLRKQGGAADHLGLNASIPATCFPPAATLANSWEPSLLQRVGEALGTEAAAENVSVLLGPGLNIKRNPLAGRNFEYFSEDPLLSGRLAGALVRGIQSRGVAACLKHFAVNSQETHRMSIDEIVDERALHEIYLEGFRIAVAEGRPWAAMSSYNKVNGTYANENEALLMDALRHRFGFDGLVVTDWGGNNDRVAGLRAGNALEMPSSDGVTDAQIVAAVEAGTLDEAVLDARVDELLTLLARTSTARQSGPPADHDTHHALAVEAASRSTVLLRNDDGVLPLGPHSGRIAVIGDFASSPRYQGAGSSLVKPTRLDAPLDALRESGLNIIGYEPGFRRLGGASKRLRRAARTLARKADVTVLFLGLDESAEAEGVDREHMQLAGNQLALVRDLAHAGTRLVVVLAGGAPVELPFAESVAAILHGYLAGQGGGRAIADVLTGRVNPSGRLAETYPVRYGDVASSSSFGRTEATAEHRESIYVGYRYFDKVDRPVRYPFGHGLSYTEFVYSDLAVSDTGVQLTVSNVGPRAGAETVQVYVEAPEGAVGQVRAPRTLAGFAKVDLEAGAQTSLTIAFAEHSFDVFDPQHSEWVRVGGSYTVHVGASSRDLRLSAPLVLDGGPLPATMSGPPSYVSGHVEHVGGAEFEELLGRSLPPSQWRTDTPLTRDDILAQCAGRGGFSGFLHWLITTTSRALMLAGRPHWANNIHFALDMPFRSIARLSGGVADDAMVDGLLLMVNGRLWRGLTRTASAWIALRRRARSTTDSQEG